MCGIAGFYAWGNRRPPLRTLKSLFAAQQTRGTSAAGLSFLAPGSDDQIVTIKQKGPAVQLIQAMPPTTWEAVAASPRALFHARATTKGSESRNENNHPVVGLGWHVTHNGMVHNDDDLWDLYKPSVGDRFAEVDTSAINVVLGREKNLPLIESLKGLTQLGGSVTAAAWSEEYPEQIALIRLGFNDLWLFLDEDILYWSSAAVAGRLMPGVDIGSTRFLPVSKMEDNRVLLLNPGERGGQTFQLSRIPFTTPRSRGHVSPATTSGHGMIGAGASDYSRYHEPVAVSWTAHNNITYPGKPLPAAMPVKKFNLDNCELLAISRRLYKDTTGITETIETPYGRWLIKRADKKDPPVITRHFKPHRRVKKFFKKEFRGGVMLPAGEVGATSTVYDDLMYLDEIQVNMALVGGTATWLAEGFGCPWCGAWNRNLQWSNMQGRCSFCRIHSKSPLLLKKGVGQ